MKSLKRAFKINTRNPVLKALAGFGRSMNRMYENRNHDIHSNGELNLIKTLAGFHPKIAIDGGANIGGYSAALLEHLPHAQVFAFEPVSDTFEKLQERFAQLDSFKAINAGLYSSIGEAEINLFESSTHSSLIDIQGMDYSSEKTTSIQLQKGDDFLKANDIEVVDLLKLDVEGAEYDALLGFSDSLKQARIKVIQFEYGYINVSSRKLLLDFYELLEPMGYKLGKLYPKGVEFRSYHFKHEDFIGPNFVAIHKDQNALIAALSV